MVPARRLNGTFWRYRARRSHIAGDVVALRYAPPVGDSRAAGPILSAEVLSIGAELTVGDTRDTNAGEIAGWLSERGVVITRLVALPDDLGTVRSAFAEALRRVDLVVSTGGLGPTPDDLTREAIAALCGETPVVDPDLETWLRELWSRRKLPFIEANLKQAWLIPSSEPISNPNGTAPGWWVDRDGHVIVALPGPPREMRPMWQESVLPRLVEHGLGREVEVRTLRTSGIGESLVVDRLGPDVMDLANPVITTYARQEAVDVRIAALPDPDSGNGRGRTAREVADETEALILDRLGEHVWARGGATWAEAIDDLLASRGWRVATIESGTHGALANLLADGDRLSRATIVPEGEVAGRDADRMASRARDDAGVEVGLALVSRRRGEDTTVTVGVATPGGSHRERRVVFLGGAQGRQRAAVAAAAILHTILVRQREVSR
jgi:nicotinamide-nucleotide amidase